MRFIKANDWYINLELVTYVHVFTNYVKVGYTNDYVELKDEDASAFMEVFVNRVGGYTKEIMPEYLIRRDEGQ